MSDEHSEHTKDESSENGEKTPFRIHQLVTTPAGMGFRFANRLRLIGQELVAAPVRSIGHAACDFAVECKEFATTDPLASLVLGLPLGGTLAALGLTPFLVSGALAVRLGKTTDTMLGGILMGTIGFVAGTALSLWVAELAVCWLLTEALLLVARAAAKVEARRLAACESEVAAAA